MNLTNICYYINIYLQTLANLAGGFIHYIYICRTYKTTACKPAGQGDIRISPVGIVYLFISISIIFANMKGNAHIILDLNLWTFFFLTDFRFVWVLLFFNILYYFILFFIFLDLKLSRLRSRIFYPIKN